MVLESSVKPSLGCQYITQYLVWQNNQEPLTQGRNWFRLLVVIWKLCTHAIVMFVMNVLLNAEVCYDENSAFHHAMSGSIAYWNRKYTIWLAWLYIYKWIYVHCSVWVTQDCLKWTILEIKRCRNLLYVSILLFLLPFSSTFYVPSYPSLYISFTSTMFSWYQTTV